MDSKKISTEQAIKIGKKKVYIPTYAFLIFGFLITITFTTNLFFNSPILSVKFIPIGLWITLISSIFIGNKLISKWKLWAFESVVDVNELRERAIQERLLYKNSPFMEKAEFKSKAEIAKWNKISMTFEDDFSLPNDKNI